MEMDNRERKINLLNNSNKNYDKGIIAIGPCISYKHQVSGQSMMFQFIIDSFKKLGYSIEIIDISGNSNKKEYVSGAFSWLRVLDYIQIIPIVWRKLLHKNKIVYITTAQSKYGFLRDMAIIIPASIMEKKIIVHQFGANYKGFYEKQNYFIRSLIRFTLSKVDKIIVEGEYVKEQFSFLNDYVSKVISVPNGLPEKDIIYATEPIHYDPNEPFRILYLSNLIETKGFWDVLEAIRILVNEKGRNVECVFAGKFLTSTDSTKFLDADKAKKEFFNIINKNNLQNIVHYFEGLYDEEKSRVFMNSNLFILPSNYINEGQPVSILEAMAYGLPIISTNYRLIPSMVVNQENGYFVEYGSPYDIVKYIEILIENENIYNKMSANSIILFNLNFKPDRYIDKIEMIFNSTNV